MSDTSLNEFARDYRDEVAERARSDGRDDPLPAAFTRRVLTDLVDADLIPGGEAYDTRYEDKDAAADGYHFDGEHLDLFVTHYSGTVPPKSLDRRDVGECFKPAETLARKLLRKYFTRVSSQSDMFDIATAVDRAKEDGRLSRIRLILLTDARSEVVALPRSKAVGSVELVFDMWDVNKLFQYLGAGHGGDPILFDFAEAGVGPLPCVALPEHGQPYQSYLAVLPGRVLYELYEKFGPRLLELNVRSFLQASRGVNRGIQDTIRTTPDNFFAYNNGISATAEEITTVDLPGGGIGIRAVRGLQIVNGGQTTASVHHAVRQHKFDVSRVYVQAKLSAVPAGLVGELVPLISRYANSQNKVSNDDFSANHPFHVEIEKLSRSVPTPPVAGKSGSHATYWFYERARGQYAEAARARADRTKFRAEYPLGQKFGKTDLAKYLNTWEQHPYWVSNGAQKNFARFAAQLEKSPDRYLATPQFFQKLVALAILYRAAEAEVKKRKDQLPAYRANVVTYSLAYMAARHPSSVELDRIWQKQQVPEPIRQYIGRIALEVFGTIRRTAPGNVTEWCKKEGCWDAVRKLEVPLDEASSLA